MRAILFYVGSCDHEKMYKFNLNLAVKSGPLKFCFRSLELLSAKSDDLSKFSRIQHTHTHTFVRQHLATRHNGPTLLAKLQLLIPTNQLNNQPQRNFSHLTQISFVRATAVHISPAVFNPVRENKQFMS